MKKFFLLPLICLVGWAATVNAQCTPDATLPEDLIVFPVPFQDTIPGSGIQDTACVAVPYSTVITIRVPETITTPVGTFGVNSITTAETGAIQNLPASMSYTCNPPTCVFLPNELGCIEITGTATAEEEGVHDLIIDVTIASLVELEYSLPDGNLVSGNYFLTVGPEGSENCATVGTTEIVENDFELQIQPNPMRDRATIDVNLPTGGDYDLSVFNAVGQRLQSLTLDLTTGQNQINFDASNLPNGMYVFTLQNGEQATSGRLLIQR